MSSSNSRRFFAVLSLLLRFGLPQSKEGCGKIQRCFAGHLPKEVVLFNESHALLMQLGKNVADPSQGYAFTASVWKQQVRHLA